MRRYKLWNSKIRRFKQYIGIQGLEDSNILIQGLGVPNMRIQGFGDSNYEIHRLDVPYNVIQGSGVPNIAILV